MALLFYLFFLFNLFEAMTPATTTMASSTSNPGAMSMGETTYRTIPANNKILKRVELDIFKPPLEAIVSS